MIMCTSVQLVGLIAIQRIQQLIKGEHARSPVDEMRLCEPSNRLKARIIGDNYIYNP